MQHAYAMYGSPLHLVLEDEVAERYNRFTKAFLEAQRLFKEEYGVQWTPDLPLEPKCEPEDIVVYNRVADLLNLLIEINGGTLEITEEQMTSEYLVRV